MQQNLVNLNVHFLLDLVNKLLQNRSFTSRCREEHKKYNKFQLSFL